MNADYVTTVEMSKLWDISSRRISKLCEEGRIEGVLKIANTWLIPRKSEKPNDLRVSKNKKGFMK